jgi:hypothetical protein
VRAPALRPRLDDLGLPAAVAIAVLLALGCRQDMHDGPKVEPLEASAFYADGRGSRDPVPGTVARGRLGEDLAFLTGRDAAGNFLAALPLPVSRELLLRGRERYDIFCSPCHDRVGTGQGTIVRRGFKRPQTFHNDRLRQVPVGYLYDVMTNGFGQMPSYRAQVPAADRWAIAAYLKVLQWSQYAPAGELGAEEARALAGAAAAEGPGAGPVGASGRAASDDDAGHGGRR